VPGWRAAGEAALQTVLGGVTSGWGGVGLPTGMQASLAKLVIDAQNERPQAMGEILSQDLEFIIDFMGVLHMTPGSHPGTYRLIHIASRIASAIALVFKRHYQVARPSQVLPALRPPVPNPGHSSYPSGHSTQAHLIAALVGEMLGQSTMAAADQQVFKANLAVLARRVARNREIAGLHYDFDSAGGAALAAALVPVMIGNLASIPTLDAAISKAKGEWS
jgi:hypothetical protein